MTSKAEFYMYQTSIEEKPEDPFIIKLEETLSKFQFDPDINFTAVEFKAYTDYLKRKKQNFDGVSTYDLEQRVQNIEKDILFIHLKNEIYENFIRRQDPGINLDADREELTPEMEKERKRIIECLESSDVQLSSEDLYIQDEEAKAEHNSEKELINNFEGSTVKFLAKMVEREISEICRMGQKGGAEQDRNFNEIQNYVSSLNQKTSYIEEGIQLIQSMFGQYLMRKKMQPDLMINKRKVLNYLVIENNRLDKLSRFIGVQSGLIDKQIKEIRDWRSGFTHVTPVDMEMLEVECLQLQDQIDSNHQYFKQLKTILDKLNIKIEKRTKLVQERLEYVNKVTRSLDTIKDTVQYIKKIQKMAEKDLKLFESQRKKLLQYDNKSKGKKS